MHLTANCLLKTGSQRVFLTASEINQLEHLAQCLELFNFQVKRLNLISNTLLMVANT